MWTGSRSSWAGTSATTPRWARRSQRWPALSSCLTLRGSWSRSLGQKSRARATSPKRAEQRSRSGRTFPSTRGAGHPCFQQTAMGNTSSSRRICVLYIKVLPGEAKKCYCMQHPQSKASSLKFSSTSPFGALGFQSDSSRSSMTDCRAFLTAIVVGLRKGSRDQHCSTTSRRMGRFFQLEEVNLGRFPFAAASTTAMMSSLVSFFSSPKGCLPSMSSYAIMANEYTSTALL
mmetsp:Transcript_5965/g.20556  ORF Transcript_5965/g.20556 Transcript_5965/m.20556 type:complete len:231 (+) Transcript_5965:362-1054(+)